MFYFGVSLGQRPDLFQARGNTEPKYALARLKGTDYGKISGKISPS
jgi:hypothetical protein